MSVLSRALAISESFLSVVRGQIGVSNQLEAFRRIVEGQHHAAGADCYAAGDCSYRRTGHGRIWVQATEPVEVSFRRPDGREPVVVRKAGAIEQQVISAVSAYRTSLVRKKEQANFHRRNTFLTARV